jgi:hypothetical protein
MTLKTAQIQREVNDVMECLLSIPWAQQLSRDVPADTGFQYSKAAVRGKR